MSSQQWHSRDPKGEKRMGLTVSWFCIDAIDIWTQTTPLETEPRNQERFFLSPNVDTTPFACQRSFWHVDETYPGTKIPETYLLGNARQIGGPVGGANAATHQNRKDLSGDDVRQQENMQNHEKPMIKHQKTMTKILWESPFSEFVGSI